MDRCIFCVWTRDSKWDNVIEMKHILCLLLPIDQCSHRLRVQNTWIFKCVSDAKPKLNHYSNGNSNDKIKCPFSANTKSSILFRACNFMLSGQPFAFSELDTCRWLQIKGAKMMSDAIECVDVCVCRLFLGAHFAFDPEYSTSFDLNSFIAQLLLSPWLWIRLANKCKNERKKLHSTAQFLWITNTFPMNYNQTRA